MVGICAGSVLHVFQLCINMYVHNVKNVLCLSEILRMTCAQDGCS